METRKGEAEGQHSRIGTGRDSISGQIGGQEGDERLDHGNSQQNSRYSTGRGEQQAFRNQLADDARAARSDGQTDGDLFLPRRGARRKQARQVRAGDEQDERRHADENQQRLLIRATETRVALRTRHNFQPHAQEVGLVERRRVAERGHGHFRFDDLVKQRLQPRLGLRDGFTGLEASEDVDPALAAIPHVGEPRAHAGRHGHGHEHLRRETRLGSIEARLRHADDGQRKVVRQDAPPNDGRIARKSRLPICVAEHRVGMFARAQIVLRREEPSGGAVDSEQREIVAGDQFSGCNFALRAEAQRKS